MIIHGLYCKTCDEFIYSRAHHDFHYCTGGHIFVDGGFDYFRCGWENEADFIDCITELDITVEELYQDWNTRTDAYGLVRTFSNVEPNPQLAHYPENDRFHTTYESEDSPHRHANKLDIRSHQVTFPVSLDDTQTFPQVD